MVHAYWYSVLIRVIESIQIGVIILGMLLVPVLRHLEEVSLPWAMYALFCTWEPSYGARRQY